MAQQDVGSMRDREKSISFACGGSAGTSTTDFGMRMNRLDMLKHGVPEDYTDALLDDDYMERLVNATAKSEKKRRNQWERYVKLNKAIIVFLVLQALLGIWIALYKTVLQPSYNYALEVNLEDVDMVLMLDASNHMANTKHLQREAVQRFSKGLFLAMEQLRQNAAISSSNRIREAKKNNKSFLYRIFPFLDREKDPGEAHAECTGDQFDQTCTLKNIDKGVHQTGGHLRIATGLFNSESVTLLHPLSFNLNRQTQALSTVTPDEYKAHAQWYQAMEQCQQHIQEMRENEAKDPRLQDQPSRRQRCHVDERRPTDQACSTFTARGAAQCPQRYCAWEGNTCQDKKPLCRKQFCIIIGDSDALCRKRVGTTDNWEKKTNDICNRFKGQDGQAGLCPSEQDRSRFGNPLEWSNEMQKDCTNMARSLAMDETQKRSTLAALNEVNDIKLIMMFTVQTDAERQMRLRNPSFRDFVESAMKCRINKRTAWMMNNQNRNVTYDEFYTDGSGEDGCFRFIMETSIEALMEKAKDTTKLLGTDFKLAQNANMNKDYRYLFFLLLPLNLVFYVTWTKLVRWYARFQRSTAIAMGKKKKMIKVTKTLVEKPAVAVPEQLQTTGELELGDIQKMKNHIETGSQVTLRCRLKGGYLKANPQQGTIDGNGHAFDSNAAWTFEPVKAEDGGALQVGATFRIRNAKGHYLRADDSGSGFVPEGAMNAHQGALEFVAEPVEGDAPGVFIGDALRLRNPATGRYLRVHKDGRFDALGERVHPETQFVVDVGGQPVCSGSVITLGCDALGALLHSTPTGEVVVGEERFKGYKAAEWCYWHIEKKGGGDLRTKSSALEPDQPPASPRPSSDKGGLLSPRPAAGSRDRADSGDVHVKELNNLALREGDIVVLKAFNQFNLEVDDKEEASAGRQLLAQGGNVTEALARPQTGAQEFIVHRVGLGTVTKHNNVIRRGAQICLKPVRPDGQEKSSDFLKGNPGGNVTANGTQTDREISFTIDLCGVQNVVAPLSGLMQKGDATVFYNPLWDKKEAKKVEALSAAWTNDKDLKSIGGAVIVAAPGGAYTVPKGKDGWVAVVNDGVDLHKAAKQVKAQGGTGLIVRCEDPTKLDRLALGCDGAAPELPAVFVNEAAAEGLLEKGLVVKGCEFKRKYMTDVMRAIGRAGAATANKGVNAALGLFSAAGRAMMERFREVGEEEAAATAAAEEEQRRREFMHESEGPGAQGNFQWKINANSHYFWASSGGGATKMKVNYGKKAPPSAHKDTRIDKEGRERRSVDASHARRSVKGGNEPEKVKRSRLSVAVVPAEEFKQLRLAEDLSEMLTQDQADIQLEELSEESDFKIEYKFEEIEVGLNEKAQDVEEAELMEDEGRVIAAVGVPKAKFWIVACGLLISTLVLTGLLVLLLARASKANKAPPAPGKPTDLEDGPEAKALFAATMDAATATVGLGKEVASQAGFLQQLR